MSVDFTIKRNDTKPDLQVTLKGADGVAINLTGATVEFHMKLPNAAALKVEAAATVVTAASGIVKYVWQSGDTDTCGLYDGEFEITFGDGTKLTCPNPDHLKILVYEDLG